MTTVIQPDTAEITVLMSEDEAREVTLKIKQYVGVVCSLVKDAHDKQAWKALGYPTWTAYCKAEFNVGKSRSYQLVKYAEVIALGTDTTGLPESTIVDSLPEGTARNIDRDELAALLDEAYANLPETATISTRRELFDALIDQLISDPGATLPGSDAPEAPAAFGATSPEPATDGTHGKAGDDDAATEGSEGAGPATGPLAESSGADGASTVAPDGAGGTGPAEGPAPSTTTIEAAERAAVSTDMVAARRLLERDPAAVVALMSAEDAETWCAHVDDMADFAHRWDEAVKDRNKLRGVQ